MSATGTQTQGHTRISLKSILYATDFSPAAAAALPYVKGLSRQYGATVHAVHVRLPATYPIVGPEMMPQVIEAAHSTRYSAFLTVPLLFVHLESS